MNRYTVTVCNTARMVKERTAYNIAGQALAIYDAETEQKEAEWDADNYDMRVYYTESYNFAQELAKILAERHPGKEVFVSEIKSIAVMPPTAIKISKVTEKGVVPE